MKGPRLKPCSKCKAKLPLKCFYLFRRGDRKRDYYCKPCRNRASMVWHKADPIRRLRKNALARLSKRRRRKAR